MKFFGLFSKKSDKYRIAPAPETNPSTPVQKNNFMQDDKNTFYVFLQGDANAFASKKLSLANIPLNHFQKNEETAFKLAKDLYPYSAITLLKVNLNSQMLEKNIKTIDTTKVVTLDLIAHATSAKGFSYVEKDFNKGKNISMTQGIQLQDLTEPENKAYNNLSKKR